MTSMKENEEATEAINGILGGAVFAKVIDHRDCDEGIKIGLDMGEGIEIAEMMNEHYTDLLPPNTFLEPINSECLRLVAE